MRRPNQEIDGSGAVASRLEEMVQNGDLERMARALEKRYRTAGDHADDAVCSALEKVLRRRPRLATSQVGPYLYVSAKREMLDAIERRKRFDVLEEAEADTESIEDRVLDPLHFRYVRDCVARWENAHIKAVTLAALDAAWEGDPLDTEELTAAASEILDRPLSADSVRSWKSRGLDRLRRELLSNGDPDYEET